MNFSVVRGADTLFGKAIATELSSLGKNLILLGGNARKLEDLGNYIRTAKRVKVFHYLADDSSTDNIVAVCDHINENFTIDILINYSEINTAQQFSEYDIRGLDRLLKINYVSTPVFTHQFLPNLALHTNSFILNVCEATRADCRQQEIMIQWNNNLSNYLQKDLKDLTINVLAYEVTPVTSVNKFQDFMGFDDYSSQASEILDVLLNGNWASATFPIICSK